jgi:hypothetical protein
MRPVSPRKNEKSSHRFGREARLYNGMTQTSSANIAAIKPSMEYAAPCMSMRWATSAIRQNRMTGAWPGCEPTRALRWCAVGSGEPSERLMPFLDSSRGARADAKGSGFEYSSSHPKSLLARLVRI